MTVVDLLAALRDHPFELDGFTVFVVRRAAGGGTHGTPVLDLVVDTDDLEIDLIADTTGVEGADELEPMSVAELRARLEALGPRAEGYTLFSGSLWTDVDDGWEARRDCPLDGVMVNRERAIVGLAEAPEP